MAIKMWTLNDVVAWVRGYRSWCGRSNGHIDKCIYVESGSLAVIAQHDIDYKWKIVNVSETHLVSDLTQRGP